MRVAIFASAYYPSLGGVEELVRQLCLAQKSSGGEAIVLTNRWPRSLPSHETIEGIDVYRLAMRVPVMPMKAMLTYHATHRMIERQVEGILNNHRIDLLHIQCVSCNALYALRAQSNLGLPLVTTLQGEFSMDADQIYQKLSYARDLFRDALENADAVTGCSGQTLQEAEDFYGTPFGARGRVIYNGVNLSEFDGGAAGNEPGPYVLGIGRFVPQKGFDVLLRAFAEVCRTDTQRRLILAGDGEERGALEQLANNLGIAERVKFTGRVERDGVVALFKSCESFVLSSRHEPFGIVNLEAMAADKPIVATRVGGVPEFVEDGVNGLLVPPDDPGAMSAALRRIIEEPGLGRRLADAGTERVKRFDWGAIADQYQTLYREVLDDAVAPAPAGGTA